MKQEVGKHAEEYSPGNDKRLSSKPNRRPSLPVYKRILNSYVANKPQLHHNIAGSKKS